MAKIHVKGGLMIKVPFYSLDVKAAFLSLKIKKDQNKHKIDIFKEKSEGKSEVWYFRLLCSSPEDKYRCSLHKASAWSHTSEEALLLKISGLKKR